MNTDRIAFDLMVRLHALAGPVTVAQVDLVPCECGTATMAYLYDVDDNCTPLVFDTPRYFDPAALQAALEGSGGTVH